MERLTYRTELGVSIDKNEDCPTCSICRNCDIPPRKCKYISDALEKLADYFEVSIDYLLGKTNFRNHIETIALHRVGDPKDDLPQEALDKIEEFKELMRLKYQKKPTSK